jgi:hypothetical protein
MLLPDWTGDLQGLIGIAVGVVLMLNPYIVIRCEARLARKYYSVMAGGDARRAMNGMRELRWSRLIQNGLSYFEFWEQAETNPRQFKLLSFLIRAMGAVILLMSCAATFLVLLGRVSGFLK